MSGADRTWTVIGRALLCSLTLAVLLTGSEALAQQEQGPEPKKLTFRVRVGAAYSTLRTHETESGFVPGDDGEPVFESVTTNFFSSRWNPTASAGVEYAITGHLSLELDFVYKRRSTSLNVELIGADPTQAGLIVTANYLEVPLLARFYTSNYGKTVRPYFYAGPALSFRLNAESEITFAGQTETVDFTDETTGNDFAFALGFGFDIGKFLNVEFRQMLGRGEFFTDPLPDNPSRWGTAAFTVGARF